MTENMPLVNTLIADIAAVEIAVRMLSEERTQQHKTLALKTIRGAKSTLREIEAQVKLLEVSHAEAD